jgi:serine phosphatase RsbU (regulator of sigma subunit)
MNDSLFSRITYKLRPDIAAMIGPEKAANLLEMTLLYYAIPLALLGLGWLITIGRWAALQTTWPLFLLLLVLAYLFSRYHFELQLEVAPGRIVALDETLEDLVLWSAALILGPVAVWIAVLNDAAQFAVRWWGEYNVSFRWHYGRNIFLNIAMRSLGMLPALWLYERLGGVYPLPGFSWAAMAPAASATLVFFLIPRFLTLPLLLQLANMTDIVGPNADRPAITRFLVLGGMVLGLVHPFAILAAGLYGENGLGVYLFLMAGAFLTSMLANRLSGFSQRSQQRSRELAALEELSRAILAAPPGQLDLPALLQEPAVKMFPRTWLHVWLFPNQLLYGSQPDEPPQLAAAEQWLRQDQQSHLLLPAVIGPDGVPRQGIVVPIQAEDGTRLGGIYALLRREIGDVRELLPALQSLAAQIAAGLRRAEVYRQTLASERMAQELEVAGRIQATFLPHNIPALAGWDMAASLIPARQTSGDFYDFVPLPDGQLALVVADVADKGTGAALYMALSRTLLRTYAGQHPADPALVLHETNRRILADTQSDQFVTVLYGVLNPTTGCFSYANAGHNPAFLLPAQSDAPVQRLGRTGIPLGIFDDAGWQTQTITLRPGDCLLLYSDGITEAQDGDGAFFGEERLLAALAESANQAAAERERALVHAIHTFVGSAPQADDITLLLARRC